jgi:D-proline reductase (dithiol) PrdB
MADRGAQGPVPYMERTRGYYRALGYETDYAWAHHEAVPFARPARPAREMTVALVTTAGPPDRSNRDARNRKQVWSGHVADPPPAFDTDVAWDRESTHVDDRETFLPIDAMQRLVGEGSVGALAPRFHGAPTDFSQRKTCERDAPEILGRLRQDRVDAAILIPL